MQARAACLRAESARLKCDDQWRSRYQAWLEGTLEHHRYQRHRDASASAETDTRPLPLVQRDGDDDAKCAYGTSQWRGFGDGGRDREAELAAELIEWCDRIDRRSVQLQCARSSSTRSYSGRVWSGLVRLRFYSRSLETSKCATWHTQQAVARADSRAHADLRAERRKVARRSRI